MVLRQLGWIALAVAVAPASARAQGIVRRAERDGQSSATTWISYQVRVRPGGTLANAGAITGSHPALKASAGPLVALDGSELSAPRTPTRAADSFCGVGVLVDGDGAPRSSVSNAAGASITSAVRGGDADLAFGIYASRSFADERAPIVEIDNQGLVSALLQGRDGDAAGIYSHTSFGGAEITNRAGGTVSASSRYHAAGIYGTTYHGTLRVTNDGVVTAAATASTRGPTAGQAYAAAIDVFAYGADDDPRLVVTNSGRAIASTTGSAAQACHAIQAWAEGGPMTLVNSGTATATADASTGAGAQAIYCGGNGGAVSFTNTGTVIASAGRGGGWGVGVENDEASPVTVVNRGSITHDSGIGLALFTGRGPVTITNTGSISGGLYGIMSTFAGPVTLHDTGDLRAGADHRAAIALGGGDDSVDISGLPTIVGVLDGGGGTNRLDLKLTGVLQSVDGEPATLGNDLAAYHLGTNGSIVVSGKTYAWTHFVVSGTVTGAAPPSSIPAPAPAPTPPSVASTLAVK